MYILHSTYEGPWHEKYLKDVSYGEPRLVKKPDGTEVAKWRWFEAFESCYDADYRCNQYVEELGDEWDGMTYEIDLRYMECDALTDFMGQVNNGAQLYAPPGVNT